VDRHLLGEPVRIAEAVVLAVLQIRVAIETVEFVYQRLDRVSQPVLMPGPTSMKKVPLGSAMPSASFLKRSIGANGAPPDLLAPTRSARRLGR
jgi:hypothetical protein